LGQIYEQKGWDGKAIEAYERFAWLWKDCDPELRPKVERAVAAAARLR
jgi:hypothetical protein